MLTFLLILYYSFNLKKLLKSEIIILIPLFILSFKSLDNGIYLLGLYKKYPHFIMVTAIMFFLYWPISYLYFKSIDNQFKFKKIYIIYFVPFLYTLISQFSFFIKSGSEKLNFLANLKNTSPATSQSDILSRIIAYTFMFLLVFLMTKEYKKIKNKKKETILFFFFNIVLSFSSIIYYIYFLLIYQFNITVSNIIGFTSYQIVFILPIFLVIAIFIIKVYDLYKKKKVLKEDVDLITINEPSNEVINSEEAEELEMPKEVQIHKEKIEKNNTSEKYQMNKINEGDAKKYLKKIIEVVEKDELYKDNNFNLTKLSKKINIPSAYISQALNVYKGETFYNFINKYRIETSKKMLKNPEYNKKTILSIAYESGFNSKATFNSFFKKTVGMTPSEYRNVNNKS